MSKNGSGCLVEAGVKVESRHDLEPTWTQDSRSWGGFSVESK